MRLTYWLTAIATLDLLIGCGGGGPVAPPTSETISASFTHLSQSDYTIGQTVFFDADRYRSVNSISWVRKVLVARD